MGKISVSWARHQDEIRQAQRAGSTYSETEFDLTRLRFLRARMVELGRSCVHAEHRHGGVILALWGALAEFMSRNRLDTMIGCASIPMQHNGVSGGHAAASIWRQVRQTHLAAIEYRVTPRLALPVEQLDDSPNVEPPALIKGYLQRACYGALALPRDEARARALDFSWAQAAQMFEHHLVAAQGMTACKSIPTGATSAKSTVTPLSSNQ